MKRLLRCIILLACLQFLIAPARSQNGADFGSSVTDGCAPLVVFFSDLSTGSPSQWFWIINGNTYTSKNPGVVFTSPGSYDVTMVVLRGGVKDTVHKPGFITVYSKPVVSSFGGVPSTICAGQSVSFSANVSLNAVGFPAYTWYFGDGSSTSSNSSSATHTYAQPGNYQVLLNVVNGSGCDTTTPTPFTVTVNPVPTATFSVSPQLYSCTVPATFTFTNTTTTGTPPYTNANWTFSSGTGSGNSVSWTTSASGPHTVSLVVKDSKGCTSPPASTIVDVYGGPAIINSPASICQLDTIAFQDATPGGYNPIWDFGDGTTDTSSTYVKHVFQQSNTSPGFTVKLTNTVGPCTKTTTKNTVVNPTPGTTVTFAPELPCPPPVKVALIANSPVPGCTYTWNFFDGGTGSGSTDSAYYTTIGLKQAKVNVTSPAGCKDSVLKEDIPVLDLISVIEPDPQGGCQPLDAGFRVRLYSSIWYPPPTPSPLPVDIRYPPGYPDTIRTWTFVGDTSQSHTSYAAVARSRWMNLGEYPVYVSGWTRNGCFFQDTSQIGVYQPTPASFTLTPTNICAVEDTVYITNNSPKRVSTIYSFTTTDTTVGQLLRDTADFISVYKRWFKKPGAYIFELVTDYLGCHDTARLPNLVIVNPPTAAFSHFTDCPRNSFTAHFTDLSIGANTWDWDFGDGSAHDHSQSPSHTYATTGLYRVKLTTGNTSTGCGTDTTMSVRIYRPNLSISASKKQVCVGEGIYLYGGFGVPVEVNYAWLLDSNFLSRYDSNSFYAATFYSRGWHQIRLVTTSGIGDTCYDTLLLDSVLVSQPSAGFTSSAVIGCTPLTIHFTDTSTPTTTLAKTRIYSRIWDYGDSSSFNVGNSTTVSHTYIQAKQNIVKLYLIDSMGCRDSAAVVVDSRKPVAKFSLPKTTVCIHDTLVFRDSSYGATGLVATWDFGDGTTSNARTGRHAYSTPGTHTVKLTVRDSTGCDSTLVKTNYVRANGPTAGFTMSKTLSVCGSLPVRFTDTSKGGPPLNYDWKLGKGGGPVTIQNPQEIYTQPGSYNIILKVTDTAGCSDTAMGQAVVLGYNGVFDFNPKTGCLPLTVNFSTVVTGIPNITWDFDDGSLLASNGGPVTHTYTSPGAFRPKAVYSDGANCKSYDSGLGTPLVVDQVTASFTHSAPCVGAPISFHQNSTAMFSGPTSFFWRYGPSLSDTAVGDSIIITASIPGPNRIILIAKNDKDCRDTLIRDIQVNPLPAVNAGPADTGICPGDRITLRGSGALTYEWGPDSLVSCMVCDSTLVSTARPTTYYLKGTDSNGCISYDSIVARIQIQTTADVKPGGAICFGDTFRLQASGATIYKWTPERFLDSPNISSPLAKPIITTRYVVAAAEGSCLVRYDTVEVVVHPTPYFDVGPDEIINYGSSVTLQPSKGGITRIEWQPDSTLSCINCFSPIAKPEYTRRYFARGFSQWGCVSTDSVLVRVRCNEDSLFIPNTFSPNGDGVNDLFFPRGKGLTDAVSLRIFNRWGEAVYEKTNFLLNDENAGWNGRYKGQPLAPDVFYYTLLTRCPDGEPIQINGDVTLLR